MFLLAISKYKTTWYKSNNGIHKRQFSPYQWVDANLNLYQKMYPTTPTPSEFSAWIGSFVNEA